MSLSEGTLTHSTHSHTTLKAPVSQFSCCLHTVFSSFPFWRKAKSDFLFQLSFKNVSVRGKFGFFKHWKVHWDSRLCCKMTEEPPAKDKQKVRAAIKLNRIPALRIVWNKQKNHVWILSEEIEGGRARLTPCSMISKPFLRGRSYFRVPLWFWTKEFWFWTLQLSCERSISTLACFILFSLIRK